MNTTAHRLRDVVEKDVENRIVDGIHATIWVPIWRRISFDVGHYQVQSLLLALKSKVRERFEK